MRLLYVLALALLAGLCASLYVDTLALSDDVRRLETTCLMDSSAQRP